MTDQDILHHYQRMVEIYGDKLPDPDHSPREFQYYVNLYLYFHSK